MALLDRLSRVAAATADVASAEIELAATSARALARRLATRCLAALLVGAAVIVGAAALIVALKPIIGLAPSLAAGSAALLALAALAWLVGSAIGVSAASRAERSARGRVETAKRAMSEAIEGDDSDDRQASGAEEAHGDPVSAAIDAALSNPKLLASAGFAAMSLFGPRRFFRIAALGASTATSLSSVMDMLHHSQHASHAGSNGKATHETGRSADRQPTS